MRSLCGGNSGGPSAQPLREFRETGRSGALGFGHRDRFVSIYAGGFMRTTASCFLSIPIALLAGCGSSGRQAGEGREYSQYVFAMYDEPRGGATAGLAPSFPMNVAVAEVGQLRPSSKLLDALNG